MHILINQLSIVPQPGHYRVLIRNRMLCFGMGNGPCPWFSEMLRGFFHQCTLVILIWKPGYWGLIHSRISPLFLGGGVWKNRVEVVKRCWRNLLDSWVDRETIAGCATDHDIHGWKNRLQRYVKLWNHRESRHFEDQCNKIQVLVVNLMLTQNFEQPPVQRNSRGTAPRS